MISVLNSAALWIEVIYSGLITWDNTSSEDTCRQLSCVTHTVLNVWPSYTNILLTLTNRKCEQIIYKFNGKTQLDANFCLLVLGNANDCLNTPLLSMNYGLYYFQAHLTVKYLSIDNYAWCQHHHFFFPCLSSHTISARLLYPSPPSITLSLSSLFPQSYVCDL